MDKKLSYDSLSSLYANFGELYESYRSAYDSLQDVGSDRITGNDERTEQINTSNQAAVESLSNVVKEYQVHVDHARRRLSKMRAEYEYYKNERDRALSEARENGTSLKDLFKNAFGTAEINRFKRMDAEINFLESFLSDYDKLTDMVNSTDALDSMFNLEMDELVEKMSSEVAEVVANTVVSRVKVEDLGDSKSVTISYDGFEFKPVIIPNDEFTMEKVEQIRNAVICKATLDKEKEMKVVLDVNGKEIETTLSQMGVNLVEELAHKVTQEEVTEEVSAPEVETEELTAEQKYENDGYSKNAFDEYFNPNIDEFDPEYNPELDPLYAAPVAEETETQEVAPEAEEIVPEEVTPEAEEVTPEEVAPEQSDIAPIGGGNNDAPEEVEEQNISNEAVYSEKTYQVMSDRESFKNISNKVTMLSSIAAAGLFGLAVTTGIGAMPLTAAAVGIAVGSQVIQAIEELRFKARRAAVKHKLKKLAKKANCVLRCEDGKAWFHSIELDRPVTSEDLEEIQATTLDEVNIQEKLDKIFKNKHRGVANPSTSFEYDYVGFQKVTVDNLEAAFEEFGGVKKEDEIGLWDKIMNGVENSMEEYEEEPTLGEEVPEAEEQQMLEAESVSAEEMAAELEENEVAPEVKTEEVAPEVQTEEVAPEVQTEEVAPEVEEVVEEVQEQQVEETQEVAPEGAELEDEAIAFMMDNSSVAEQIGRESNSYDPASLSPEEIQDMLEATEVVEEETRRMGM